MYEDASSLSKSKIININDFIFRQNLDFYPNLKGLVCKDNELIFTFNGEVIAREIITFDLRELPGDAWLVSPLEFIDIIRLNKKCINLHSFTDYVKRVSFSEPKGVEA